MIPLYKLEKLPRIQKLRKIAKIFNMAESRLSLSEQRKGVKIFSDSEIIFFADASKLLAEDALFSDDARMLFKEASVIFCGATLSTETVRRTLNNVKHLIHTAIGRDQADWDFGSFDRRDSDGMLNPAERQIFEGMLVYLEDIRSPFNVGAMFRTAESFGVEKIILSPFCADPHHRRAQRTAMGCIDIVPWERQNLFSTEEILPLPYPVFALETGGIPLNKFPFPQKGFLIAGSEELGVSPRALAAADASLGRVSIPCYGAKASLNVSVAFGIAVNYWAQAITSGKQG
ncbi:MAG: TrmH family RNA methyltransferase [Spirochaetes bacterium]|nr:TrmH family RNA methyltransferase [Brevinematales bacterium]MCL1958549.1 TrmH family RNA methyltransferase [Spirochaetota bacterium]